VRLLQATLGNSGLTAPATKKGTTMRIETVAVHAGAHVDPGTGAVTPAIHPSTTFERDADGSYPRGFLSLVEHRASIEGAGTRTPENLLRLSVGLEHPDDLIDDLGRALS